MEQLGAQLEALSLALLFCVFLLAAVSPLLYAALVIALPIWRLLDDWSERRSSKREAPNRPDRGRIQPRGRPRPPTH